MTIRYGLAAVIGVTAVALVPAASADWAAAAEKIRATATQPPARSYKAVAISNGFNGEGTIQPQVDPAPPVATTPVKGRKAKEARPAN